jgi:hypothetical protein
MVPSSFHGTLTSNPVQWLVEVDRYFTVANLPETDSRRVLIASTYLKDSAATWFSSIVAELGDQPSWSSFKKKFIVRWQPLAASKVARAALRKLKHHHRVAGYNQEFQKILQQVEDMSITDQIENYVHGLQPTIGVEVEREEPKSLSEAMEVAQRVELLNARHGTSKSYNNGNRFANSSYSRGRNQGSDDMDLSAIQMNAQDSSSSSSSSSGNYENNSNGTAPDFNYESYLQFLGAMSFQNRNNNNNNTRRGGFRRDGGRPFNNNMNGYNPTGPRRQVDGLSREEFDRLSREGKCFKCQQTGHLARNCNQSKKSSESKNL